ncbi:glucose-1-phosphate cytidylyltransferase [Candidatus Venteria ishoeyi]|uniref:Glucose-1-phosphate cytidylyltransferase n=1 Tax=Candidatus Venteria ishoeyi TaxID=1899563 RepID=A0A1H6F9E4_9GAMM|nr:glucose-1-phosphate cytidylyltransferase [Candidatus Venteria ishoeyi]SEH05615.1 Glucose-1-phosphate cytidylyltransferase [Candidatus Venteria ishoeyi]
MQAVILAGGLGTRLSEETSLKPKPMVEIGGRPILWHIMKIYSSYGINDFIICLGYKGYIIKEYFANYLLHQSDISIDLSKNNISIHQHNAEPWKITLVDTGDKTQTGGRLKRVQKFITGDTFCFTYGDGLADVNVGSLIEFHQQHNKLATILAVQPPGRFGALAIEEDKAVSAFEEKPHGEAGWINGGFFVLSPKVIDYIDGDETVWEQAPLTNLSREQQLSAYINTGFWQPMDTLRDKNHLESLWQAGNAPWKVWK